jgi:hypothetical protein
MEYGNRGQGQIVKIVIRPKNFTGHQGAQKRERVEHVPFVKSARIDMDYLTLALRPKTALLL